MLNDADHGPSAFDSGKVKGLSRLLLSAQPRNSGKSILSKQWLWMVAFALLIAETVLLITAMRWGPGVSPDSVNYAKAAEDFRDNLPMTMVDGSPLSLWPPLYPALLGTLWSFGLGISNAAILLNIVSLWVAGISFTCIILRIQLTHYSRVLAISFFTLSSSQHLVFRMLWSEGFFIAIVMLSLALFISKQSNVPRWNISATLVGLGLVASLTKFVGLEVFLAVGTGILAQILLHRQKLRDVTLPLVLVVLGAALVTPLFMGSNRENSQPFGARLPSESTLISLIKELASLSGSYLIDPLFRASTIGVGSAVMVLCFIGVVRALVGKKWGLLVPAVFLSFFWALTFPGKLLFLTDTLDFRLGSPAFGPSLIFFFIGLEGVTRFIGRKLGGFRLWAKWQPITSKLRWGLSSFVFTSSLRYEGQRLALPKNHKEREFC